MKPASEGAPVRPTGANGRPGATRFSSSRDPENPPKRSHSPKTPRAPPHSCSTERCKLSDPFKHKMCELSVSVCANYVLLSCYFGRIPPVGPQLRRGQGVPKRSADSGTAGTPSGPFSRNMTASAAYRATPGPARPFPCLTRVPSPPRARSVSCSGSRTSCACHVGGGFAGRARPLRGEREHDRKQVARDRITGGRFQNRPTGTRRDAREL